VNGSHGRLTTADIVGASSTTALATAIVAPYVLDRIGVAIAPWPMLVRQAMISHRSPG
jgi:hypothetical protein